VFDTRDMLMDASVGWLDLVGY